MEWARKQIKVCQQRHEACRVPLAANEDRTQRDSFLPERLIDVGKQGDLTVRLIQQSKLIPRSVEYVALSYCWGGLAGVRLCKSNLGTLTEPTRITNWDKTYRDAIAITRLLGIRYLWIDALCIMQPEDGDDGAGLADWTQHAPVMGRVYTHAACVLSATRARNTADGCVSAKMLSAGGCHLRKSRTRSLDVDLSSSVNTVVDNLFQERVDHERLSTRGWAFQERVLASRILHLCEGVVLFECNQSQGSGSHQLSQPLLWRDNPREDQGWRSRALAKMDDIMRSISETRSALTIPTFEMPMPSFPSFSPWELYRDTAILIGAMDDPDGSDFVGFNRTGAGQLSWGRDDRPSSVDDQRLTRAGLRAAFNTLALNKYDTSRDTLLHHHCWYDLVRDYSARDLTNPTDKVVAIAGLAEFIPHHFEAGILFDDSHKLTALNLLWVRFVPQGSPGGEIPPRPERLIPTWSWASIDGRISQSLQLPPGSAGSLVNIIRYFIYSIENNREKLRLSLLRSIFALQSSGVNFRPDIPLEPYHTGVLFCMPIIYLERSSKGVSEHEVHGIVVRKVSVSGMGTQEESDVELERMGSFWIASEEMGQSLMQEQWQRVVII
ncbi:hypothetical protein ONZ43_g458 [Nemania bipapillata]|uniref:Uncharacterized protein n=1 Tax=Nemania bipapillata TaxID=110536 RepID=A0ACC2J831_9PEZI|nr:hypothetical protein ONZ43_g458 [Nemania bipapillata]